MAKSGITSVCECVIAKTALNQIGKFDDKVSNELNVTLCVDELISWFCIKIPRLNLHGLDSFMKLFKLSKI